MPPKKSKKTQEDAADTTPGSGNALTGTWISGAGETNLVARLCAAQEQLEGVSATGDTSTLSGNGAARAPYSADFLDAVLTRNMLRHPSRDVKVVLAAILADVLRLGLGHMTPAAAASLTPEQLPWDKKHSAEAMLLFQDVLTSKDVTREVQRMRALVLEALSRCHGLVPLIRHAKLNQTAKEQFFTGLLFNSGGGITGAYAAHAASAICDVITASAEITDGQVDTLLSALNEETASARSGAKAASATGGGAGGGKKKKKNAAAAAADAADAAAVASTPAAAIASIAAACFRREEIAESCQRTLITLLVNTFEDAAITISNSDALGSAAGGAATKGAGTAKNTKKNINDVNDDDDDDDNDDNANDGDDDDDADDSDGDDQLLDAKAKQQQRRIMQDAMQKMGDLCYAAPNAVKSSVLPQLCARAPLLQLAEARLLFVKHIGSAFLNNAALSVDTAREVLLSLIGRVRDVKVQVRLAVVPLIAPLLQQHAEASAASASLWHDLPELLAQATADTEESVRKAAISAAMDLAVAVPQRVPVDPVLVGVGRRCSDKKPAVRALAVDRLAAFYLKFRPVKEFRAKVDWIPGRFLDLLSLTGGAHAMDTVAVERAIESMLPSPDRVADGVPSVDAAAAATSGAAAASAALTAPTSLAAAAASGGKKKNLVQKQLSFGNDQYNFDDPLLTLGINNNNNNKGASAGFTFAEAFTAFISDVLSGPQRNAAHMQYIETLFTKKRTLRKCAAQLFALRVQAKALGKGAVTGSAHGQQVSQGLVRMVTFMNSKFNGAKIHSSLANVWSTMTQIKDEKAARLFGSLDSSAVLDFGKLRNELQASIKASGVMSQASSTTVMSRFVDENMLVRFAMPFSVRHVSELVRTAKLLRAQVNKKDSSNNTAAAADTTAHHEAVMTALKLIAVHSPQLLAHSAAELKKWVLETGDASADDIDSGKIHQALVDAFRTIGEQLMQQEASESKKKKKATNNKKDDDDDDDAGTDSNSEFFRNIFAGTDIEQELGRICLHSTYPGAAAAAATAIVSLHPDNSKLFNAVLKSIDTRLQTAQNQPAESWPSSVASWFRVFGVFADQAPKSVQERGDRIAHAGSAVLIQACRAQNMGTELGYDAFDQVAANRKSLADFHKVRSLAAETVDATAGAIALYTVSLDASRGARALHQALNLCINGIRACSEDNNQGTVGSALKRYGIHRAILRLVSQPPSNVGGNDVELMQAEIQAAICISAETHPGVRDQMQQHITRYTMAYGLDARFLSLLCMTAVAEDTRAGYNRCKEQLVSAMESMLVRRRQDAEARAKAAGVDINAGEDSDNENEAKSSSDDDDDDDDDGGASDDGNKKSKKSAAKKAKKTTTSTKKKKTAAAVKTASADDYEVPFGSPEALRLYPEYCIPFVVTYMGHHTFFHNEILQENNLNSFQRVWFVLFEAILRTNGVQTVPLIHEVLRKMKIHDDALHPDSTATRVIVDLGSRVLQKLLEAKSVGAQHSYPGAVILPLSFTREKGKMSAEKSYLPKYITVGNNAPMKAAFAVGAAGVTPAKGARSAEASVARFDDDDDADMRGFGAFGTGGGADAAVTPQKNKKPAAKAKAKAAGKKPGAKRRGRDQDTSSSSDDDDDDDDDESNISTPPNTAAKKKKPAAKGKKQQAAAAAAADNDADDAAAPSPSQQKKKAGAKTPGGKSKKKGNALAAAKQSFIDDYDELGMPQELSQADAESIFDFIASINNAERSTLTGKILTQNLAGKLSREHKKQTMSSAGVVVMQHLAQLNL